MNTTEKTMIKAVFAINRAMSTTYSVAIPNCYTQCDNEADLFFIRKSGFSDEVEIKVSRSDLLQDKKKMVCYRELAVNEWRLPEHLRPPWKKPKYDARDAGELTCNYFWYAIKEGIGSIQDIPEYAGLIVVNSVGKAGIVRWPRRLHGRKLTFEQRYKFACKLHYRYWGVSK